jgi:hypothetical protein
MAGADIPSMVNPTAIAIPPLLNPCHPVLLTNNSQNRHSAYDTIFLLLALIEQVAIGGKQLIAPLSLTALQTHGIFFRHGYQLNLIQLGMQFLCED